MTEKKVADLSKKRVTLKKGRMYLVICLTLYSVIAMKRRSLLTMKKVLANSTQLLTA
ncbi:hypothetical protein TEHAB4_18010 [Tetragenococcus halophilus]|uniref:hypothetical protein n=1 Tax=Tetragenococcus halophilus TaxID=51669 RepID=UPI00256B2EB6|nr:hypothetical protein [Tetragenococcus halophilus]MDN6626204.1 hypothetical protein [Pisciglobus halotolerans]GMG62055.1 hypothetical protein TEHAB4_18010 [Tetragenococcus halophilus]